MRPCSPNSATRTGFSVTVDNTAPAGSDIQTANVSGGTQGKPETGDTVTFTFSEVIDPNSVIAGWTGTSTSVTVRLLDGGIANDTLQVWNAGNTSQLPLGQVNLGRIDYVATNVNFTSSAIVQSASSMTITLGTASGGLVSTALAASPMAWSPSSSATDRAANACSTSAVTESGSSDKDF